MKNKKRNRVILAICSMFIACMSLFAFIPKEKEIVKADSVSNIYEFKGSNLPCPITPEYLDNNDNNYHWRYDIIYNNVISFDFVCNEKVTDINVKIVDLGNSGGVSLSYVANLSISNNSLQSGTNYMSFFLTGTLIERLQVKQYFLNSDGGIDNILYKPVGFYLSSSSNSAGNIMTYHVEYFDAYYNKLCFDWDIVSFYAQRYTNNSAYELSLRQYFFDLDYLYNNNEYYALGYDEGLRDGYDKAILNADKNAYSNGYNQGKNDGYNLGYNAAVSADKYSFDKLLSSAIDVPVRTFTSLFNFEILGVNLSGFFLGLLTCCIVITIVRLLL